MTGRGQESQWGQRDLEVSDFRSMAQYLHEIDWTSIRRISSMNDDGTPSAGIIVVRDDGQISACHGSIAGPPTLYLARGHDTAQVDVVSVAFCLGLQDPFGDRQSNYSYREFQRAIRMLLSCVESADDIDSSLVEECHARFNAYLADIERLDRIVMRHEGLTSSLFAKIERHKMRTINDLPMLGIALDPPPLIADTKQIVDQAHVRGTSPASIMLDLP